MSLSHNLYTQAKRLIPGGVNSPVRAFNGVGGEPVFVHSALGAYITDADGKHYIDYVGSWGPMILGHNAPQVVTAVREALDDGMSFGAPTQREVLLAMKINQLMPSMEMVRMVNSGTEATMSAIRLARGYTGRDKIIKFAGCYHGHSDSLLVNAGSGALTLGVPSSPGVPSDVAAHTLVAEYNNLEQVRELFELHGGNIAAIIVEPVAGNMNLVLPQPDFLPGLRTLCDRFKSVLIFDEVMTGFRVALGGAQALYQVKPDLTTLGKIIGGGMPVGAFGGKREIMSCIAPLGPVYQAGTLSGNPLAMAAGIATLDAITKPGFYHELEVSLQHLLTGLTQRAQKAGIPFFARSVGGMFGLYFCDEMKINNLSDMGHCDVEQYKVFFHSMLKQGIYLAPSAYEVGFISSQHAEEEIQLTLDAAEIAFSEMAVKSGVK